MRSRINNVFPALPIVCLLILSCSSGSNEPVSKCGQKHTIYALDNLNEPDAVKQSTANSFAGEKGTEVSVSWSCKATNVCAHMHSYARFSFAINPAYASNVRISAVIWYGILRERPINFSREDGVNWTAFEGEDEFGIRDVYGDGAGEYHIFVDMFFPSTGHWDSDSAFVENAINFAKVKTDYYEHK